MSRLALLALAAAVTLGQLGTACAGSRVTKVYAPNGRRVAVIKRTAFGTKIYGQDGRRIATVRSR